MKSKWMFLLLVLAGCATQYPIIIDYQDPKDGQVFETRILHALEERPILDYYRYEAVTKTPGYLYAFEVLTSYPVPEGVRIYICFDSLEVNEAPRKGDIKKVRYLHKKKRKRK